MARRAGATAHASPLTSAAAAATSSTRPLSSTFTTSGNADGIRLNAARVPHDASTTPTAPPANARQTLSVSACRRMRARLAPSAARTANSRDRRVNRARMRLLTLAHAMSSTNVTIARRSTSVGCRLPTRSSLSGTTLKPTPLFASGYAAASDLAMVSISARASARPTSGRRRPIAAAAFT